MVKNNNKTMDNKTAITELMEIVEMDANNGVEISMGVFYKMLQDALPKERQQIEEAYQSGGRNALKYPIDYPRHVTKEEYFNQTYQ